MNYKCLRDNNFSNGEFNLVPIRGKDRYLIMQWRNDQTYHLRQSKQLTATDQDSYFSNVVSKLFTEDHPSQLLFSYLHHENCIGYGGLVRIDWKNRHAEISFIMDTSLEKDQFEFHWKTYLALIEEVAFRQINLHKIYTHAYDLRPRLYDALEESGYRCEARLLEHCYFGEKFIDVVVHAKVVK